MKTAQELPEQTACPHLTSSSWPLAITARTGISHNVKYLLWYRPKPTGKHWDLGKHFFRYFKARMQWLPYSSQGREVAVGGVLRIGLGIGETFSEVCDRKFHNICWWLVD